jgi:hypothetical protein
VPLTRFDYAQALKTAIESEEMDLEDVKEKMAALQEAQMKIGKAIYAQQPEGGEEKKEDDIKDAEFEEKEAKEEKKPKN